MEAGPGLAPPVFTGGDSSPFWGMTWTYDAEALITLCDIEQFPVIPTARVGSILNHYSRTAHFTLSPPGS